MKRLNLIMILLGFLLSGNAFSLTKMHVHDPHGTWREYPANIEEVSLSIKPKGLFSEIGLYLTISERDNHYNYNDGDSLEIVLDFELPKEAVVNDLWLWVYGHIIKGKIMDKWTAGKIYDDIVGQKKDPSIIYKKSDTQYQIRIYPMSRGEERKIKLTYLLPNSVIGSHMVTEIPGMELMKLSRYMPKEVKMILKESPEGIYPEIIGGSQFTQVITDTLYGSYKAENVPLEGKNKFPVLRIPNALEKGYYISKFNGADGENYFHLTTLPANSQNISRKILFLVDYESGKSDISKGELLESMRQMILQECVKDSVAILFSGLTPTLLAEQWISGALCPELPAEKLNDYSNMVPLFSATSNWQDADDIILISANHAYADNIKANSLHDDIVEVIGKEKPVHIIDLCNSSYAYAYLGGRYYYNNEYLYTNLSQQSHGNYITRFHDKRAFDVQISEIIRKSGTILKDFTLKTGLTSGWTYSEYDSKEGGNVTYASEINTKIGKFNGSGDFEVETYFTLDGIMKNESIIIPQDKIPSTDSTLRQYWYGHFIYDLEQESADNATVAQIIEASTENRVLSRYTSFLCLEPSDTVPVCDDCFDESQLDTPVMGDIISGEQNIFTTKAINGILKLEFTLPASFKGKSITVTLYNLKGQIIKTVELTNIRSGLNNYSLDISGVQSLAAGNYILTLRGEGFAKQSKFTITQ